MNTKVIAGCGRMAARGIDEEKRGESLASSINPKDLMKALAALGIVGGGGGAAVGGVRNALGGKSVGRGMLTGGLTGAGAGMGAGAGALGGILGTEQVVKGMSERDMDPSLPALAAILGGNALATGGGAGAGGYAGHQLAQKLMGPEEEEDKKGMDRYTTVAHMARAAARDKAAFDLGSVGDWGKQTWESAKGKLSEMSPTMRNALVGGVGGLGLGALLGAQHNKVPAALLAGGLGALGGATYDPMLKYFKGLTGQEDEAPKPRSNLSSQLRAPAGSAPDTRNPLAGPPSWAESHPQQAGMEIDYDALEGI